VKPSKPVGWTFLSDTLAVADEVTKFFLP